MPGAILVPGESISYPDYYTPSTLRLEKLIAGASCAYPYKIMRQYIMLARYPLNVGLSHRTALLMVN